ncbi:erythroid membrane-associated protein-like [Scomber scombrus]|uniref:erythroid membrane-associated protein-like n=1 Tax=Scomber scombrus TaxID=13677 RepID=UPI002DD90A39|nr:erythroid membrane-associated protein-like [Scomber scombrus]
MVRKEDLLETLEDLTDEEFKDFKCLLKDESLAGYQTIRACRLQKAERRVTVDLMVKTYQLPAAVEATKKLLKKINRNDLLQRLSDRSSGPEGQSQEKWKSLHFHSDAVILNQLYSQEHMNFRDDLGASENRGPSSPLPHLLPEVYEEQQAAKPRVCAGTKLKACLVFLGILVILVILVCRVFICYGTVVSVHHPSTYEGTTEGTTEGRTVAQLEETLSTQMKNQFEAELKRVQQYAVDVTLDPDTAHPYLILSADGKQVYHGDVRRNLPDNPERFSRNACVLGKQSLSSGRFYFEVQVEEKTKWDLGVARESINRKGQIILSTLDGFWTIVLRNGNKYKACNNPSVDLSLKSPPQKVGVFVDYEEGLVSFYDVDTAALIYSFTGCSFTEKLYPYFSPCTNDGGKNSAPLIICPVN